MARRREIYRLGEVEDGLLKREVQSVGATLLTDLQQGLLTAVVEFPAFRNGRTPISKEQWQEISLKNFRERTTRRAKEEEDFEFTVGEFVGAESERLARSTLAIFRRDLNDIDPDFREHFATLAVGLAEPTAGDWETLAKCCIDCWQALLDDESARSLYPVVTATEMDRYLSSVAAEQGGGGKSASPGGRPSSPHWPVIYEEIIRRLVTQPELLVPGKVELFATIIHKWAKGRYSEKTGVIPNEKTIGEKLRSILKQQ